MAASSPSSREDGQGRDGRPCWYTETSVTSYYTIVVERAPLRPFSSLPTPRPLRHRPPPRSSTTSQRASYKTINVYRGPRRPVT